MNNNCFFRNNELIDCYPEVNDIICDILQNPAEFYNKFDEKIYLDYAPFSFMHSFKYILFETTMNEELFISLTPEDYLKTYFDCVCRIPYDNFLNDFFVLFSRLFTCLKLINKNNQFIDCWDYIKKPIQSSWFAFARGLSIKFHDTLFMIKILACGIKILKKEWSFLVLLLIIWKIIRITY